MFQSSFGPKLACTKYLYKTNHSWIGLQTVDLSFLCNHSSLKIFGVINYELIMVYHSHFISYSEMSLACLSLDVGELSFFFFFFFFYL